MNQWKKKMAIILAAVLVIVGLNISPGFAAAADGPKFYADDISAQQGSQIEVPVKISGNTGIMGLGLEIGFDGKVLTPIDDVQKTDLLPGIFNDSVATMQSGTNAFKVLWSGTDAMAENGHLFTVKFRVAEGASGSTRITLKLLEDETFDGNYNNVAADCHDIKVTIQSSEPDRTGQPTEEPTGQPTMEPTEKPIPTVTPDSNTGSNTTEKNVKKPDISVVTNTTFTGHSNKVKKPGKVTGVQVFGKKRKMIVLWNWKTGASGYQIQYAWNKKFTKKKKSKFVGKKTSKTITKLKKGKKYYIRVRAFRKISGKKVYGKWSKVKKCKVK